MWIYDLHTNQSFTLKQIPLTRADLDEFVACFNPGNRHERVETWSEDSPDGRWRCYPYDELMARDKVNLPDPDVLAVEIVEDLQAALEQFAEIAEDMGMPV